jgi:nitrogen-specific signal transduction histidine kinase
MKNNIDLSMARFLMILSLVLLGVLEYMWLRNEFDNKYRDMQDELNHVMLTTLRDVEDSLIFNNLEPSHFFAFHDTQQVSINIKVSSKDSIFKHNDCVADTGTDHQLIIAGHRPRMRGLLLERLSNDSSVFDTPVTTIASLVMRHMHLGDSTGDLGGYKIISWSGKDTVVPAIMSHPQFDVFGGKKMALSNSDYKADIFQDLVPHMSFALLLWLIVGAAFFYIWKNLRRQLQLNALRDEFVGNITHELKTPITTAGVALETLRMSKEMNAPQDRRYLEICQSELKRLSMLVERILHSNAPQIHYEKIDMRQILDDVMDHMKVQFEMKEANIEVVLEGDHFQIRGDKSHISSVLYNLLENALKYSPEHPSIKVVLRENRQGVRLDVHDNGIGIDPGYHHKIFERLYRVPNENRHDVKGHGLGLSYVADVVKKHQGEIDIISDVGKGSTFSIKFPALHEN